MILKYLFNSFKVLSNNDILNLIDYLESNNFKILKYGYSTTRPQYNYETKENAIDYYSMERNIVLKGDNFAVEISGNINCLKPFVQKFSIKFKKNVEQKLLLKIAIDLFIICKSCYGFVSLEKSINYYTPGRNISDCLFGFSWLNIFGKPYIDMWGLNKILKCPAIVDSNKDYFTIMLSENPLVKIDEISITNNKLKAYFGYKYFFNEEFEFEKTSFSNIEEIVKYQNEKFKNKIYKAPIFEKYY